MRRRVSVLTILVLLGSCKTLDQINQCNGNSECIYAVLRGYVRDNYGYQEQSFGGMGSAAASAKVQLAAVQSNGSLSVMAEAMVMADGSYSIDKAPTGQTNLVVQALDASGKVTAQAIVSKTP